MKYGRAVAVSYSTAPGREAKRTAQLSPCNAASCMTRFTTLTFVTPPLPCTLKVRSSRLGWTRPRQLTALLQYLVDQSVAHRLVPVHEMVAVGVLLDALDALTGVLRQDLVQQVARPE